MSSHDVPPAHRKHTQSRRAWSQTSPTGGSRYADDHGPVEHQAAAANQTAVSTPTPFWWFAWKRQLAQVEPNLRQSTLASMLMQHVGLVARLHTEDGTYQARITLEPQPALPQYSSTSTPCGSAGMGRIGIHDDTGFLLRNDDNNGLTCSSTGGGTSMYIDIPHGVSSVSLETYDRIPLPSDDGYDDEVEDVEQGATRDADCPARLSGSNIGNLLEGPRLSSSSSSSYFCIEEVGGEVLLIYPLMVGTTSSMWSDANHIKAFGEYLVRGGVLGASPCTAALLAADSRYWVTRIQQSMKQAAAPQPQRPIDGVMVAKNTLVLSPPSSRHVDSCNGDQQQDEEHRRLLVTQVEQLREVLEEKERYLVLLEAQLLSLQGSVVDRVRLGDNDATWMEGDYLSCEHQQQLRPRPRTAGGVLLPASAQLADDALHALPHSPLYSSTSSLEVDAHPPEGNNVIAAPPEVTHMRERLDHHMEDNVAEDDTSPSTSRTRLVRDGSIRRHVDPALPYSQPPQQALDAMEDGVRVVPVVAVSLTEAILAADGPLDADDDHHVNAYQTSSHAPIPPNPVPPREPLDVSPIRASDDATVELSLGGADVTATESVIRPTTLRHPPTRGKVIRTETPCAATSLTPRSAPQGVDWPPQHAVRPGNARRSQDTRRRLASGATPVNNPLEPDGASRSRRGTPSSAGSGGVNSRQLGLGHLGAHIRSRDQVAHDPELQSTFDAIHGTGDTSTDDD